MKRKSTSLLIIVIVAAYLCACVGTTQAGIVVEKYTDGSQYGVDVVDKNGCVHNVAVTPGIYYNVAIGGIYEFSCDTNGPYCMIEPIFPSEFWRAVLNEYNRKNE